MGLYSNFKRRQRISAVWVAWLNLIVCRKFFMYFCLWWLLVCRVMKNKACILFINSVIEYSCHKLYETQRTINQDYASWSFLLRKEWTTENPTNRDQLYLPKRIPFIFHLEPILLSPLPLMPAKYEHSAELCDTFPLYRLKRTKCWASQSPRLRNPIVLGSCHLLEYCQFLIFRWTHGRRPSFLAETWWFREADISKAKTFLRLWVYKNFIHIYLFKLLKKIPISGSRLNRSSGKSV